MELGILEDFLYQVLLLAGTVGQTLHLLQRVQHLGHSSLWKKNSPQNTSYNMYSKTQTVLAINSRLQQSQYYSQL